MDTTRTSTSIHKRLGHYSGGTEVEWYEGRNLSHEERETFRQRSRNSQLAKRRSLKAEIESFQKINLPCYDPAEDMPQLERCGLTALSLFSGGGGLDLGFDLAGFRHLASYELMGDAGRTLQENRPQWTVHCGPEGNVSQVDWSRFRNQVDVLHGGPPCQPFSISGRQRGKSDTRDLLPEFVRAVLAIEPKTFVAENVPALAAPKFSDYRQSTIYAPLERSYEIHEIFLNAHAFGVPQKRKRGFFVGLHRGLDPMQYCVPESTHEPLLASSVEAQDDLFGNPERKHGLGVRKALGLPDIGYDATAPTFRSTLTGPRHTTSILSSVSALKEWERLQIWPNGVSRTREDASRFPTKNGHFRLSAADVSLLQGFPASWRFHGAVYVALGQVGNSVAPPVAYQVACSLRRFLSK